MRLNELLEVMPAESKVMITVITQTGGIKKGPIMKVYEAINRYHIYESDKVINVDARYDWRSPESDYAENVYTGILVSTLWRFGRYE